MLLQIEQTRIDPDIALVELAGKLALGRESQRIEALIEELSEGDCRRVIFDMSGIEYIDSAGIGLLALAAGRLKESGGTLAVVAPEGRVNHMLRLTQLDAVVGMRATLAEALGAFGVAPPAAPGQT